jgi:DNA-binding beta-propeller fold protein YncE
MIPIPHAIKACALAVVLLFPFSAVHGADAPPQNKPDKPWVWPLPPEKPRVQHVKTFITPQDLGVKKGFFAKLWEFIAGADTVDRIISPHGIVADGNGKVYVADWGGKCVHFFDFDKKKYDKFSKTKIGYLSSPIGAALDAEGTLYITDSALKRVFVFGNGKHKRTIGDDGSLLRPTGIAINAREKRLYVTDTLGHRVDVFTLEGKKLFSIGRRGVADGEFNYPTHLAIGPSGDLYVMDTLNFRVQIFEGKGKFLGIFGRTGTGIHDFIKPKGIAVDSEGHVWVSDELRNSIQVFDRQGRLLLIFGKSGIGRGEFNLPAGLFFDGKDQLYIADSYNYRVQMFQYLKQ